MCERVLNWHTGPRVFGLIMPVVAYFNVFAAVVHMHIIILFQTSSRLGLMLFNCASLHTRSTQHFSDEINHIAWCSGATDRKWNHLASNMAAWAYICISKKGSFTATGAAPVHLRFRERDLCAIFKTNLITFNKRYKTVDNCWIYGLLFVELDWGG